MHGGSGPFLYSNHAGCLQLNKRVFSLCAINDGKGGKPNMEEWIQVVSEVGFPIVVTLYLLHRIESKLDTLNSTIQMLPNQLNSK